MYPVRKTIRMQGWDYSRSGYYFVTIDCKEKGNILGKIISGNMVLSDKGRIVWNFIYVLKEKYPIYIDEFVVMPDHIHLLICIVGAIHESPVRINDKTPVRINNQSAVFKTIKPKRSLLSLIVGFLKANSSKELGLSIWQRNYYEEIIRNEVKYWAIKQYTIDNPKKWDR